MKLTVQSGGVLRGEVTVAADKSISHRAVMLASLATGTSRVTNLLEGEDVLATVAAFRQMGVRIERTAAGEYIIHGAGLHGLRRPDAALDMGNSGTAMRLLAGVLCAQPWVSELTGDASLQTRPMARIITPLRMMRAEISGGEGDTPPLRIAPAAGGLRGIEYAMPVASAQVKSCLFLAGLYASGETCITEPGPTRDHTERMLRAFGVTVSTEGGVIILPDDNKELTNCAINVPADLSAAAFFMLGASVIPGSEITLPGVGVNPSRNGVVGILQKMGADIVQRNSRVVGGEPVADLTVRAAALHGCEIDGDEVALAIDEIPAVAVAAAFADGVTSIRGAGELRVKESDRIRGVVDGLRALGVSVNEFDDGMEITGGGAGGGRVDSRGDHRIAMAFAMAGAALTGEDRVTVADADNINTSFPNFVAAAKAAGLNIHVN